MPTHADLEALRLRKMNLNGQILVIEETLAAGKAAFAQGGMGNTFVERAELESKRARLRRERHEVHEAIEAMRAVLKPRAQGLLLDTLCKNLEANGMHGLIREAKAQVEAELGEQSE